LLLEFWEVSLDLLVVLVWPWGNEEVVVVLYVLEFVGDHDGMACVAVPKGY
jgi:hypothetical protein